MKNIEKQLRTGSLGNIEIVKILIEADANVNATDFFGKTALMIASSKNNIDIAKLLIENGADVNMQDKNGVNSLMIACDKNNIDICYALLDHGTIMRDSYMIIDAAVKYVQLFKYYMENPHTSKGYFQFTLNENHYFKII
jgi:ankyrin repeat protein